MKSTLTKAWNTAIKRLRVLRKNVASILGGLLRLLLLKINMLRLNLTIYTQDRTLQPKHGVVLQKLCHLYFKVRHYIPTVFRFLLRLAFAFICLFPLSVSIFYILNRVFNSKWEEFIENGFFIMTSLSKISWISNLLNVIDYGALGNVAMSIGVTGALFSWLLQIIKDEECGVEVSSLFKEYYPNYILNLWSFIASTAVCIYCCESMGNIENPRPELQLIIMLNLVAMLTELLYMALMCRKFLFSYHTRKALTIDYLVKEIETNWKLEHGNWFSTDLNNLFGEFSYIVTKTQPKKNSFCRKKGITSNKIAEVIACWASYLAHDNSAPCGGDPIERNAFRSSNEIVRLLYKNVTSEMIPQLHGCLMIADHYLRCANQNVALANEKSNARIALLRNRKTVYINYFSTSKRPLPKWISTSLQKIEHKYSETIHSWDEYLNFCNKTAERKETISAILSCLYLMQYIKQNKEIDQSSDSALNFFDEINIASSFMKAWGICNDEAPCKFMLLYCALLLCFEEDNPIPTGSQLSSVIQSDWRHLLKDLDIVTDTCFAQARGSLNMSEHIPYHSTTQKKAAALVFKQILIV